MIRYVLPDVIKEDNGSCDALLNYIAQVTREKGIVRTAQAIIAVLGTARTRGQWDWDKLGMNMNSTNQILIELCVWC